MSLRATRIRMRTIPLLLILVSVWLTLAPAKKIKGEWDDELLNLCGPVPLDSNLANNSNNASLPERVSQDTSCECVPYYLCRNGTILTTGETLLDIRGNFKVCEHYTEVCCELPNKIHDADVVRPEYKNGKGCGVRNSQGVGYRITGNQNNEVEFGEFPWTVAVLTPAPNSTKLILQCGGSLIHKQAVLTAAHCVRGKEPDELKIRAGEWDTRTKNEILPHQDRNVKNVIIHEKFHAGTLFYDLAILILSDPVDLAGNVDIVCLPEKDVVFDESRCVTGGWGKDKFSAEGQYQVILKKVELPIVPHGTCQNTLRKTRLGKYFVLDDSFICAGGESDKDTCKGDGGSPLVCPSKKDPTRYQQAGIVAWGIGCGNSGIPGVYANVAYARDWIDKQMTLNHLDNSHTSSHSEQY